MLKRQTAATDILPIPLATLGIMPDCLHSTSSLNHQLWRERPVQERISDGSFWRIVLKKSVTQLFATAP
jgi:hypothetical protein